VSNDLELLAPFMESLIRDGGYRSVLGFFTMIASADRWPAMVERMDAVRAAYPDRLYVLSVIAPAEEIRRLETTGWICHEDPTRAVNAIAAMGRYGEAFAKGPGLPPPSMPPVRLPETTPSEAEAKRLLAEAGIPCAPEAACADAEAAVAAARRIGFPVVLKILSPDILHKSEIGGVILDVADEAGVREGFALLMRRGRQAVPGARIEGVLVARQLKGGVECILGIHRDPVFGPVAMFGLGGVFVEVLHDVVFRRGPFGEDVAEAMIRSIKGAPLLLGARGRPPADVRALAAMLARLSAFAAAAGERLRAVDLNPVLALPDGEGAFAVDAVIEV
jgi:acyl-CoA synthetase (NDP forming)